MENNHECKMAVDQKNNSDYFKFNYYTLSGL